MNITTKSHKKEQARDRRNHEMMLKRASTTDKVQQGKFRNSKHAETQRTTKDKYGNIIQMSKTGFGSVRLRNEFGFAS